MNILVLDVGTSSMRGTLMNGGAEVLFTARRQYAPVYGEGGLVEQNPADWLNALRALCGEAAAENNVDAVALTAQRSSLVPTDSRGVPVRRAIMWQDTRNSGVCVQRQAHSDRVRAITGADINTVFSGGKMAWFRENEPAQYNRTDKLSTVVDYLIFHMTGRWVTDCTYGSRSMLMDLRTGAWSPELLELFGVEEEKLCRLIPPGSVAGTVNADFAARTGLAEGIPVVTCGGDQQCAAIGQGVIRPGIGAVNLGTGAYLTVAAAEIPEQLPEGVICGVSTIPGQYILEASVLTCGSAVDWFLPNRDYFLIGRALRSSPPGAKGVVVLPYFQGRSAPDWNSRARGAFIGLSLDTDRLDMLRSLIEGICVEIGRCLGQMDSLQPVRSVRLSGGLSRTPEVGQLVADVTGKTVLCAGSGEATVAGAWMSAARCLGVAMDWEQAWETVRRKDERLFIPSPERTVFYKDLSARTEALYQAMGACAGTEE